MKYLIKTATATLFAVATAAGALAMAETGPEGEWTLLSKSGDVVAENQAPSDMVLLAETGKQTVTFNCSDNLGLQARVYMEGNSADDIGLGSVIPSQINSRAVSLSTPTKEARREQWVYVRADGVLITSRPWQAKRIYNASITGEPVTLSGFRLGKHTFSLPAVNDDFKTFASKCDEV